MAFNVAILLKKKKTPTSNGFLHTDQ
jgi:hypothetical protein